MDFTDTVYMFPSPTATLSPFDSFLVIIYSFCDVPIAIVEFVVVITSSCTGSTTAADDADLN